MPLAGITAVTELWAKCKSAFSPVGHTHNTSDLTNDSGFITDAGVTSFNGSTGAVSYTAPVTSVNGSTGAVTVNVPSPGTGSSYPAMNGTRSLGSSAGYARVDHVHPTDTSRQAALVSGTNIKTVNNESLLGSGDISIPSSPKTIWYCTATRIAGPAIAVSAQDWTFTAGNVLVINMPFTSSSFNTVAPTIRINDGEPVQISCDGKVLSYDASNPGLTNNLVWDDGEILTFVYDGTYFQFCSRSLSDRNVITARCSSTGSTEYLDLERVCGFNGNDINKKNELLLVYMTSSGSTGNYTGSATLKIRLVGKSTNLGILRNNSLVVGSSNGFSWVSGEFLVFVQEPATTNWRLVNKSDATLPTASASTLGGVKVGDGLAVDSGGTMSTAGPTLVPIGTILDFAGATAPTGYLVCDGSAVSRTDYAALFEVIGTTWGGGDGSTTFNVPDLRGRAAIGAGTGTATDATAHALGSKGGTETHKLTAAQSGVPAHAHPLANSSIVYNANATGRMATSGSGTKISTNTNVDLNTYNNTAANASSEHPNMQPYATVTKIIRAE